MSTKTKFDYVQKPFVTEAVQAGKSIDLLVSSGCAPYVAKALVRRGIANVSDANYQYGLLHYKEMLGIGHISDVLSNAIIRKERIVIVADYDCDGATACAIGVSGMKALGADIDYVVPNRFMHGYGLTPSVVDEVLKKSPKWILTVDNGIASNEGVTYANKMGVKVLVTDHHLQGDVLPNAEAIVDPNQKGCGFPSKNLAGCGVMYYVLAATRDQLVAKGVSDAATVSMALWLDLVALGTVADVVKLDDNNRWLVHHGISRIRDRKTRPGILALFDVAGKCIENCSAQDFGFGLAPRLNAAGRLEDMSIGIQCLLSEDYTTAIYYAKLLQDLNIKRKSVEQGMKAIALQQVDDNFSINTKYSCVVFEEQFHEGVVGIVAGRIKELLYVPTIAFSVSHDGSLKGSGRSIPEVHLRDVLDVVFKKSPGLLLKFGGHAMAAGLTIPKDRLEEFKQKFDEAVGMVLGGVLPSATMEIDDDLPATALTLDSAISVQNQVWGQGFLEPLWEGTFTIIESKLMGADKNHLRMILEKDGEQFSAVHFFDTDVPNVGDHWKVYYKLGYNEFNGIYNVQLMVHSKLRID